MTLSVSDINWIRRLRFISSCTIASCKQLTSRSTNELPTLYEATSLPESSRSFTVSRAMAHMADAYAQ